MNCKVSVVMLTLRPGVNPFPRTRSNPMSLDLINIIFGMKCARRVWKRA